MFQPAPSWYNNTVTSLPAPTSPHLLLAAPTPRGNGNSHGMFKETNFPTERRKAKEKEEGRSGTERRKKSNERVRERESEGERHLCRKFLLVPSHIHC